MGAEEKLGRLNPNPSHIFPRRSLSRLQWTLLSIGILAMAALGAFVLAAHIALGSDPVVKIQQETLSPDGKKKLVLFTVDVGATSVASLHASILGARETVDSDHRGNIFVISRGQARLHWEKDGTVTVDIDPQAEVFKRESTARDTKITYYARGGRISHGRP